MSHANKVIIINNCFYLTKQYRIVKIAVVCLLFFILVYCTKIYRKAIGRCLFIDEQYN